MRLGAELESRELALPKLLAYRVLGTGAERDLDLAYPVGSTDSSGPGGFALLPHPLAKGVIAGNTRTSADYWGGPLSALDLGLR
jgi:hypothetical protein